MSELYIYKVKCSNCPPEKEEVEEDLYCKSCKNYLCEYHYIISLKNKNKCNNCNKCNLKKFEK